MYSTTPETGGENQFSTFRNNNNLQLSHSGFERKSIRNELTPLELLIACSAFVLTVLLRSDGLQSILDQLQASEVHKFEGLFKKMVLLKRAVRTKTLDQTSNQVTANLPKRNVRKTVRFLQEKIDDPRND